MDLTTRTQTGATAHRSPSLMRLRRLDSAAYAGSKLRTRAEPAVLSRLPGSPPPVIGVTVQANRITSRGQTTTRTARSATYDGL